MIAVALGVALGLLAVLIVNKAPDVLRRWKAWRNPGIPEECATCGVEMPMRKAHVLVDTWDDPDLPGAGTGVSIAYCRAHCPGGCVRGCREKMAA